MIEIKSPFQKFPIKTYSITIFLVIVLIVNFILSKYFVDFAPLFMIGGDKSFNFYQIISANFIELNFRYLITTVIGLLYFGSYIEKHLRHRTLLIIYLLSGIGSMFIYSFFIPNDPKFLFSSSIGALCGVLAFTYMNMNSTEDVMLLFIFKTKKRFTVIILFIWIIIMMIQSKIYSLMIFPIGGFAIGLLYNFIKNFIRDKAIFQKKQNSDERFKQLDL